MLKDTFNSIFDNFKERTTNPFLGTLVVVWLFKNWKLVYSLIYFDSKLTLQDRLNYIEIYFKDISFTWNLIHTIFLTIGILVVTYILLSLSRLLSDTYERVLIPLISKWTDKSSIVLKTDYHNIIDKVSQLEERLENEKLSKAELKLQRDSLEERYVKLLNDIANGDIQNDDNNSTFRMLSNNLKLGGKDKFLDSLFNDIQNNVPVKRNLSVGTELLSKDYLYVRSNNDSETVIYGLTNEGKRFKDYWDKIK